MTQRLASLVWPLDVNHLLSTADLRPLWQLLNSDVWLLAPDQLDLLPRASESESGG